jgi:hypothetical protein
MNPYDPALEKNIEQLLSGVQGSAAQCMVIPQVSQAMGSLGMHINVFFQQQRKRFLEDMLNGNGPMAKLKRMILPLTKEAFHWDLVRAEPITHTVPKPLWVQNHAFTEYVRYVNKRRSGDDTKGFHDMPYITVPTHCGFVKLLCLKRQMAISQANDTGDVCLEYSVPAMHFRDFSITSRLEEVSAVKQGDNFGSGSFNFQYDVFWDRYYTTATHLRDREYKPGLFRGVVLTEKDYREPIEVRLHEFLMVQDEEGVRFIDGVITFTPQSWQPCGYVVSFSREMACVLGVPTGSLEWQQVPRVYQELLVQVPLTENESISIEVTFDPDYTPVSTILSRRPLDVDIVSE